MADPLVFPGIDWSGYANEFAAAAYYRQHHQQESVIEAKGPLVIEYAADRLPRDFAKRFDADRMAVVVYAASLKTRASWFDQSAPESWRDVPLSDGVPAVELKVKGPHLDPLVAADLIRLAMVPRFGSFEGHLPLTLERRLKKPVRGELAELIGQAAARLKLSAYTPNHRIGTRLLSLLRADGCGLDPEDAWGRAARGLLEGGDADPERTAAWCAFWAHAAQAGARPSAKWRAKALDLLGRIPIEDPWAALADLFNLLTPVREQQPKSAQPTENNQRRLCAAVWLVHDEPSLCEALETICVEGYAKGKGGCWFEPPAAAAIRALAAEPTGRGLETLARLSPSVTHTRGSRKIQAALTAAREEGRLSTTPEGGDATSERSAALDFTDEEVLHHELRRWTGRKLKVKAFDAALAGRGWVHVPHYGRVRTFDHLGIEAEWNCFFTGKPHPQHPHYIPRKTWWTGPVRFFALTPIASAELKHSDITHPLPVGRVPAEAIEKTLEDLAAAATTHTTVPKKPTDWPATPELEVVADPSIEPSDWCRDEAEVLGVVVQAKGWADRVTISGTRVIVRGHRRTYAVTFHGGPVSVLPEYQSLPLKVDKPPQAIWELPLPWAGPWTLHETLAVVRYLLKDALIEDSRVLRCLRVPRFVRRGGR